MKWYLCGVTRMAATPCSHIMLQLVRPMCVRVCMCVCIPSSVHIQALRRVFQSRDLGCSGLIVLNPSESLPFVRESRYECPSVPICIRMHSTGGTGGVFRPISARAWRLLHTFVICHSPITANSPNVSNHSNIRMLYVMTHA